MNRSEKAAVIEAIKAKASTASFAVVTDANVITGNLFVKLVDSDSIPIKVHRDDVKLISRSKKRLKEQKKPEQ